MTNLKIVSMPERPGREPGATPGRAVPVGEPRRRDAEPEGADEGLSLGAKLNWLRAAVLGANDGIVSVAGLVVGVAGATTDRSAIALAGVAGVVAGALSMSVGEFVSVSTQRDTEKAVVTDATTLVREDPQASLAGLTRAYRRLGFSTGIARAAAEEMHAQDPVGAQVRALHGIDEDDLTNPWHAAWASFLAFLIGAALPVLAILLPPPAWRVPVTMVAVLLALALTGWTSARLGGAPRRPAVVRNVIGGALAMLITYGVGTLFGTHV